MHAHAHTQTHAYLHARVGGKISRALKEDFMGVSGPKFLLFSSGSNLCLSQLHEMILINTNTNTIGKV